MILLPVEVLKLIFYTLLDNVKQAKRGQSTRQSLETLAACCLVSSRWSPVVRALLGSFMQIGSNYYALVLLERLTSSETLCQQLRFLIVDPGTLVQDYGLSGDADLVKQILTRCQKLEYLVLETIKYEVEFINHLTLPNLSSESHSYLWKLNWS